MPKFIDSRCGGRPPRVECAICLLMAALVVGSGLLLWRRGREAGQDAIPEASARAQVEAARARERATTREKTTA